MPRARLHKNKQKKKRNTVFEEETAGEIRRQQFL